MGVFKDIMHELKVANALLEAIRENTLKTRIAIDGIREVQRRNGIELKAINSYVESIYRNGRFIMGDLSIQSNFISEIHDHLTAEPQESEPTVPDMPKQEQEKQDRINEGLQNILNYSLTDRQNAIKKE